MPKSQDGLWRFMAMNFHPSLAPPLSFPGTKVALNLLRETSPRKLTGYLYSITYRHHHFPALSVKVDRASLLKSIPPAPLLSTLREIGRGIFTAIIPPRPPPSTFRRTAHPTKQTTDILPLKATQFLRPLYGQTALPRAQIAI